MRRTSFLNRRVAEIEDSDLLVTLTEEGGHIARLLHKPSGINPLWTPPWASIEPSAYDPERHPEFGGSHEAKLVAGMLGHILCLDLFGAPTPSEAAAGMPVHGEAATAAYSITGDARSCTARAALPLAQLRFARTLRLAPGGVVFITETVENLSSTDRPIAWTQHVTLGAPFLEAGRTRLLLTATDSRVIGPGFNQGLGRQQPDADFRWPLCPLRKGGIDDLSVFSAEAVSGGFTAHRMDAPDGKVCFVAWSPSAHLLIGYVWHRQDFPWLARWEENHLRPWAPWNHRGFALGMEFGVSPFVEDRRQMVARSAMFHTPNFLWLGAGSSRQVQYAAFVRSADALPSQVAWDGHARIDLA